MKKFFLLPPTLDKGNKISYNRGMEKNNIIKSIRGFEPEGDLQKWLGLYPDYKEQIKAIREAAGMTQEQLAHKVDRTPRSIRTIENGEAYPRITTLQRIADALDAELHLFLVPKDDFSPLTKETDPEEEIKFPVTDKGDITIGETD
jgi:transcriptional regulator with XRE-family HTH domain